MIYLILLLNLLFQLIVFILENRISFCFFFMNGVCFRLFKSEQGEHIFFLVALLTYFTIVSKLWAASPLWFYKHLYTHQEILILFLSLFLFPLFNYSNEAENYKTHLSYILEHYTSISAMIKYLRKIFILLSRNF